MYMRKSLFMALSEEILIVWPKGCGGKCIPLTLQKASSKVLKETLRIVQRITGTW